jgi:hypothetical protein
MGSVVSRCFGLMFVIKDSDVQIQVRSRNAGDPGNDRARLRMNVERRRGTMVDNLKSKLPRVSDGGWLYVQTDYHMGSRALAG